MGMNADLMAIGKLTDEVREYFEYGADAIDDVENGTVIVSTICVCSTRSESIALADALGISYNKFWQHYITNERFFDEASIHDLQTVMDYDSLEALIAFRDNGFDFIYRPNY